MKGIVFQGDKKLEIQDFDDPSPGPDDVIIEIKASGMCGSDLKFYRANSGPSSLGLGGDDKPVIVGHEPCGTIIEIDIFRSVLFCSFVPEYLIRNSSNSSVPMLWYPET